jgi:hypothetical protein
MVGLRQLSQIQLFNTNYLVAQRETFQTLYYTTFRVNPNANPNMRVSKKKKFKLGNLMFDAHLKSVSLYYHFGRHLVDTF